MPWCNRLRGEFDKLLVVFADDDEDELAAALAAAAAAYLLATVPLDFSGGAGLSGLLDPFVKLFALDKRSNTALALRKRDTRLAVRLSPAVVEFRDGDEVVDPFKLLLLPLSLSLSA